MWIDAKMSNPIKKGLYKCLVVQDDYGTLKEETNEVFNGDDWCHYNSCRQFISFWWATKEEYQIISDHLDEEKEKYLNQLEEESKNFGGL